MRAKSKWARSALVAAACLATGAASMAPVAARSSGEPGPNAETRVVPVTSQVPIYLDPTPHDTTVAERPVPGGRSARRTAATSTIEVTYHGFTPQAMAAFQKAVDIWSANITSSVPIKVDATWAPLPTNVLGQAGPAVATKSSPGARANTWYPIALANALAGHDLAPTQPDISATFSNAFSAWYLGIDGHTPLNQVDFVSVVLHELGHGLGFLGFMTIDDNNGFGTWGPPGEDPGIYDRFTVDSQGPLVTPASNNTSELGARLLGGDVRFAGTGAVAANGGAPPRLYAPSVWEYGSSYSHLDEDTYGPGNPNSLMTPAISPGETEHDPGAITLGIFDDMGWKAQARTPAAPRLTPTAIGDRIVKLTWSAPADSGSQPISGYVINVYGNGATTPSATIPFGASARAATITGLANGSRYRFTIAALNGVGTGTESALSGTLVPANTSPFADSIALTTRTLTDFIGRAPTSTESSTARGELNGGATIPTTMYHVAHLPGAIGQLGKVTRLYRASFLRLPATSSLSTWLARYRSGTTLQSIAYSFAANADFVRRYGPMSNSAFVQAAYRNVLGRAPSSSAA